MPFAAPLAALLAVAPPAPAPPAAPAPDPAYIQLVALSQLLRESEGGPATGFYLQLTNGCPNPIRVIVHVPAESDAFGPKGDRGEPPYFSGWIVLKPQEVRRVLVPRILPRTYHLRAVEEVHKHLWGKDAPIEVPVELETRSLAFTAHDTLKTCAEVDGVVVGTHRFICGK